MSLFSPSMDHAIATLPEILVPQAKTAIEHLEASFDDEQRQKLSTLLAQSSPLASQLLRAMIGSPFVLESICRHPQWLLNWLLVDAPYTPLTPVRIFEMAEMCCAQCTTVEELDRVLRQLRQRLMLAVIWRDANRLSDFAQVCQSMTAMAEACIAQALNFHYRLLVQKHGVPIGRESGQPQPMLVIGMGKLGGAELNVSSDIDLLFVFPEAGETDHSRPLENQQFFTRLGQRLIKTLNDITVDGFVFRVDMRLRPYGQSGALVSNFTALENYYQTQGREWERFAAIKARVVASSVLPEGDLQADKLAIFQRDAVAQLDDILLPFTYRKYIDFSVIDALRRLKDMIVQEVRRKGMETNIKLGAGGIRELEFIVQSFQLIRGGRDTQLQQRHWLSVLEQLCSDQTIEVDVADDLKAAYLFLRHTEHAIQYYRDQQTQELPVDALPQAVLAWLMGHENWPSFVAALEQHRACVSEQFQMVIAEPEDKAVQQTVDDEWSLLWHDNLDKAAEFLEAKGCQQADAVLQQLTHLKDSWSVRQLSATARDALDHLIPQLLDTVAELEQPDTTLLRMLVWLEKIVGRSSYITLLRENPMVLRHLSVLFQGSVWIAELLAQMPSLLDELLDIEGLYTLPSKEELQHELHLRLLRVPPDDLEAHMEVLRYFKLAHSLRVAVSELAGSLKLMKVSDYLTWIAEVVLEEVMQLAWQQLKERHGLPSGLVDFSEGGATPGFMVIGYGKLGGLELSYSSDLDLVFLYQADAQGVTDGEKSVDNQTFYTRLGQKIIHILNTRTLSGPLYEVDMRLRPSGNSGLLVSSMSAFSHYQQHDAWTWEHQALVRARPICGDSMLIGEFLQLRQQVLGRHRDGVELKQAVIDMRQKMRDHLGSSASKKAGKRTQIVANTENNEKRPLFHLKQDAGGIVDIEFMVQYAVLAGSHTDSRLSEYTDNVRILESLQHSGFITSEQVKTLTDAYLRYRQVSHRLALQQQSSLIDLSDFSEYSLPSICHQVQSLWQALLSGDEKEG